MCSSSSIAKVVPLINQKAMDSSTPPNLPINPLDNPSLLPVGLIKPVVLTFEKKIILDEGLISTTPDHQFHEAPSTSAGDSKEDYDKKQVVINSVYQAAASPEGKLWLKVTELDDLPSTPEAISAPAYLFPKQSDLNDYQASPSDEKQVIREPAYLNPNQSELNPQRSSMCESEKPRDLNCPSSPPLKSTVIKQVVRGSSYQSKNGAERDAWKANSADDEGMRKRVPVISEGAYHDKLQEIKESYRSSERGRLSSVVEESESFSRREFGANVLHYMSTHSSANHAENFSTHPSYNRATQTADFSYKHPSYHHNNLSNFSYTHSSYHSGNFMTSKSAPAGSAARSGLASVLFRRGMSEGGNLRMMYRRPKSRKPQSLAHTLLWPLVKIRNGYVGCMMGLEGAGDLSGMAQGSTYATNARYFDDMPLSKADSRNHG